MIDYASSHVVYRVGDQIRSLATGTGRDSLLLTGAASKVPTVATVDARGFAWGRGPRASFECAGCIGTAW